TGPGSASGGGAHDFGERRRCAAQEAGQVVAGGHEVAGRDRPVERGDEGRRALVEPGLAELGGQVLDREVAVPHGGARDGGDGRGQLAEREGLAAELVDDEVAVVPLERRDRGRGVVGAWRRGDAALCCGADDLAAPQVLVQAVGVVLGVPAVAQQREGHARLPQDLLGALVLAGQRVGRGVGVEDAGVGDALDARGTGGLDHRSVLGDTVARLAARDEQQALDAGQRTGEGLGAVVVALAHLYAALGEVGGAGRRPGDRDDVRGRDAPLEQLGDGEPPEVAGGAGDGVGGHGFSGCVWEALTIRKYTTCGGRDVVLSAWTTTRRTTTRARTAPPRSWSSTSSRAT